MFGDVCARSDKRCVCVWVFVFVCALLRLHVKQLWHGNIRWANGWAARAPRHIDMLLRLVLE